MRNLKQVNKICKQIESVEFYGRQIFLVTKNKNFDDYNLTVYEIDKNDVKDLVLNHHKKAQAVATIHDIGLMICVDVDRIPYYYFY